MSVIHMWAGAVTPSSARVRAKVAGAAVRLAVADNSGLSGPAFFGPVAPTGDDIASIEATDLDPDTQYWYAIETDGTLQTGTVGRFRTHPPVGEPASFAFAAASCAGHGTTDKVSNSPIFDTIRDHPVDPLFFAHLGDMHYRNIAQASVTPFRDAWDDVLAQPRQHHLYRTVPIEYVWDDHDFGPNDSDRTSPGRTHVAQVYRERVPHYPLPDSSGAIYHHFQVGRVLFLATDLRFHRDPNSTPAGSSKTMLGTAQRAWMESVLDSSGAEALIWLNTSQWMGTSNDSWSNFAHERDQLVQLFGDTGWLDRMCIVTGDKHALGIDTGGGNTWGGFPVYMFAALHASWGGPEFQYDTGPTSPGQDRYGTVQIHDTGDALSISGTGWIGSRPWRSHTFNLGPMHIDVGGETMRVKSITGAGSQQTFTVQRAASPSSHSAGTSVQINRTGQV